MRVLMLAPGTRGDVAPAAGLGARLQAAGHDVTVVADAPYELLASAAGCAFRPVPVDLRELIATSASGPRRQAPRRLRVLLGDLARYFEAAATTALTAAADADAVLVNAVAPFWAARVTALGAGPAPVPRSRVTDRRLAAAISAAVNTPDYRRNARHIASQLAREDGAAGLLSELDRTVTTR